MPLLPRTCSLAGKTEWFCTRLVVPHRTADAGVNHGAILPSPAVGLAPWVPVGVAPGAAIAPGPAAFSRAVRAANPEVVLSYNLYPHLSLQGLVLGRGGHRRQLHPLAAALLPRRRPGHALAVTQVRYAIDREGDCGDGGDGLVSVPILSGQQIKLALAAADHAYVLIRLTLPRPASRQMEEQQQPQPER
jgi:hypothetical protein